MRGTILRTRWYCIIQRGSRHHQRKTFLLWRLPLHVCRNLMEWFHVSCAWVIDCFLQRERKFLERLMIWIVLILFLRTRILLVRKLCCMCSKTMKQWSKWSLKEGVRKTRFQNPQSCAWLVVWQNQLGAQNPNQIHRHQKPTRWFVDERQFLPWCVEPSPPFCLTSLIFRCVPAAISDLVKIHKTMGKTSMQEEKPGEEERVVEKSKPVMGLCRKLPISLQQRWVRLKAHRSKSDSTGTEKPAAEFLKDNTASSSQAWHSEENPNTNAGKPAAETTKNPMGTTFAQHSLTISQNYVGQLEKVHSNVRQKLGRQPGDDMPEIDVNTTIWRILHVRDNEGSGTSWTRLSR